MATLQKLIVKITVHVSFETAIICLLGIITTMRHNATNK